MQVRHLKTLSLMTVAVFTLSGCGWLQEDVSSGSYNRWESSAATTPPPPQTRVMQTADGTWLEPDNVAKPVPNAMELAELKQANTRIAQLEDEISSLRNDMNMMMPALTKLAGGQTVTAETLNNIQTAAGGSTAAGEVTRIHRNYMQPDPAFTNNPEVEMDAPMAMASPVMPPAAPLVAAPPVSAPPVARMQPASYTPPAINISSIKGIRFGNHDGGKSRMVIDVTAAPAFTFDIDNNERILMVEIPGTVWNAGPVTKMLQDHPLIQSMAASPDGQGGTRVVFQLKAPAKVLWSQAIPPSGAQGHRLVFDISAL